MNLQKMVKGRKVKQVGHARLCILIWRSIGKGGT
ncbi:MAG: hypothetical protein BWX96_03190 [Bacteroidetes bacterium ADurb.Bin145]|nr:MAG: hypothetical protein BWX96_03190 [Bacteroidetes bacterium ADurb.Bin145]